MIERFNGNYRKEVLSAHLFFDNKEVRDETQKEIQKRDIDLQYHQTVSGFEIDWPLIEETILAIVAGQGTLTESTDWE